MATDKLRVMIDANEIVEIASHLEETIHQFRMSLLKDANEYRVMHTDDQWTPTYGSSENTPPKEKYDWVLVKIKNKITGEKYILPRIAEFRKDGQWWSQELNEPYGSYRLPFEVTHWRPLPDDLA